MAIAYAMDKLRTEAKFFIHPGDEISAGQVVGEHSRGDAFEYQYMQD